MTLLRLWQRLILGISLGKLILFGLNNPAIANPANQNNLIKLIASSKERNLEAESRLAQSREMIQEMDDSQKKVVLLNNLAINYAQLGKIDIAIAILEQSLSIANSFEDLGLKVTTTTNIAKYYAQIGQTSQAIEILDNAVTMVNLVEDKSLQSQLFLEISLKYGEFGQEETAQTLLAQSQIIIAASEQPLPEFPFMETPRTLTLEFFGNVNSFRETTALVGIEVDYAKFWSEDDIFVNGLMSFDFDSSRTINNPRPRSLILVDYRHHFNAQWNFFIDFFNSTNQSLFASRNNDEDLTIISELFVGSGLNLWRGDSRGEFLDLQLGLGASYKYDFIDFEERRNQIDPALAIILSGRGFSLGKAKLNQSFVIVPPLNNFNDYVITFDTNLSIPLSEEWSLSNRLFLRYRNELVFEANPKWEFFFTTGFEYKF